MARIEKERLLALANSLYELQLALYNIDEQPMSIKQMKKLIDCVYNKKCRLSAQEVQLLPIEFQMAISLIHSFDCCYLNNQNMWKANMLNTLAYQSKLAAQAIELKVKLLHIQ